ncbi:MAG: beta-N-acetylhexosaminidase [Naasia sp.]|nr:beta-N-acetylhexosaminidase [Naasia sp.]
MTGSAGVLLPGFAGEAAPGWLLDRLRSGLAGVCLFGGNISSLEQLRRLTGELRAARADAVIAIDEEGGDVTRLWARTGSPYPGNAVLGRLDDPALTEEVGRSVGEQLAALGVTLTLAPDADVNSTAENPVIGVRSFGADPGLVARHTAAWVRGLQSTGVAACAKHFPGHGGTTEDSHLALPVVDRTLDELRDRELIPFRAAIDAGVRSVMTSHLLLPLLDPARPATFSPRVLGALLRDELGFDGAVVTDALDMAGASGELGIPAAAVRALGAGADLLCLGSATTATQVDATLAALDAAQQDGSLAQARTADAARRAATLTGSLLPQGTVPEPDYDLVRTMRAFEVRPGVRVEAVRRYATLETGASIAVGESPWGVAAAGATVSALRDGDAPAAGDGQLVLVGRDNHRHAWVRDLVDRLRAGGASPLVIDMGWPGDDRRYADIATFGASRHVGRALLAWLEGTAP